MMQNATPAEHDLNLSPAKIRLLEALLAGRSISDTAAEIGTSRSTVHRWTKAAEFQAAYNELRAEMWESVDAKLYSLRQQSLDVIQGSLDNGDVRTALAILRGTGALDGTRHVVGSDDPDEIAAQQEKAEWEKRLRISLP
jgi:DNA-binding MurR/RpiR family transcriptional regulator